MAIISSNYCQASTLVQENAGCSVSTILVQLKFVMNTSGTSSGRPSRFQ